MSYEFLLFFTGALLIVTLRGCYKLIEDYFNRDTGIGFKLDIVIVIFTIYSLFYFVIKLSDKIWRYL